MELPTPLVELTLASLKGAGRLDRYLALLPASMHAGAMVAQQPCIRSHGRLVISLAEGSEVGVLGRGQLAQSGRRRRRAR